jgi:hypothetical protein
MEIYSKYYQSKGTTGVIVNMLNSVVNFIDNHPAFIFFGCVIIIVGAYWWFGGRGSSPEQLTEAMDGTMVSLQENANNINDTVTAMVEDNVRAEVPVAQGLQTVIHCSKRTLESQMVQRGKINELTARVNSNTEEIKQIQEDIVDLYRMLMGATEKLNELDPNQNTLPVPKFPGK